MIKALKDNNFNLHPLLKNYDENRILDYRNITELKLLIMKFMLCTTIIFRKDSLY